jgi:hypothetical protein
VGGKSPLNYPRAVLIGDFSGAISAAAIDHQDFVRNFLHGRQYTRKVFLFILRDDADG